MHANYQSSQAESFERPFEMQPLSWARAVTKRTLLLLTSWFVCTAIAATIIFQLPPVYKAGVLIQVEGQRIPKDFVAPTVDTDLSQQLGTLKQNVLSYSRLLEVVNHFNLYAKERRTHVEEQIVDMMRSDITVETEKGPATSEVNAFRIQYMGPNPKLTAAVANQLGNLFVEENLRSRQLQAEGTAEFLNNQLTEAKKRLEEQEAKLSSYKVQHNGQLPEQETALLAQLNELKVQLQGVQDSRDRAQQSKIMIDASLRSAEDDAATLAAAAHKTFVSSGPFGADQELLSKKVERELLELRRKYTPDHPDVIQHEELLAAMREQEKKNEQLMQKTPQTAVELAQLSPELAQSVARNRERSAQLRAQEDVVSKQISDYEREWKQIVKTIASLQSSVGQLPVREQDMASLTRDYQISKANYQSLLDKELAAEMAGDMERRQKAERFTILEPARIPQIPFKPNRRLLSAIGCLIALIIAAAIAILRELRQDVLLGEWELPSDLDVLARLPAASKANSDRHGSRLQPSI